MKKQEILTLDKKFYSELGKKISEIRHQRGYSLRYMSELTGLSRATIDYYELGLSKIKLSTYEKICKALGISPRIKLEISVGETIGSRR